MYVDFWATWCAPCRSGIQKIKPLKEELSNEAIVFVYITNQTSPEDTWNLMVPDISGEHYRLNEDEWNYLAGKYNISGIPHYMLLDSEGNLVNDSMSRGLTNEELKKILAEYLDD